MEDSTEDLINDDAINKTEMKFEQGGVAQKFAINGKRRNESHIMPGKLYITENRFGEYLEWKPLENPPSGSSSPFKTGLPELHGARAGAGIGFRKDDEETVEFLPDPREAEYRRPIKVELTELRSYLMAGKREIIFIHSDGTTLNPFVFERGSPENFITALERSIGITKSKHNKNLFMFGPKRDTEVHHLPIIPPGVAELFPDQVNQINHIWGFVKEIRNNPYESACTVAAKIGHLTMNGELPGGHLFHIPGRNQGDEQPKDPSPSRNGFGKPDENTSIHSDGMDADYTTNEEGYEVIFKPEKPGFDLPPRPETYRGQPLSQEWLNYLDNEGRVTNIDEISNIVFHGGVEPSIRTHVWPFLLGLFESDSTYEERRYQFTEKTCSYNRIKMQWATITEDQEERFHAFRDYKSLIEKDVSRTDRTLDFFKGDNSKGTDTLRNILMTYMMYNFNLGYVQGMSDVLAPILMEIQDEILSFWLFVKFMERIHTNFEMSQEGMQKQLRDSYSLLQLVDPRFGAYLDACDASNMYFGFRWLLIWFKREFTYPDVLILWESLWTQKPGPNYQLFIGLAILVQHRSTVMENKFGLSEILRHVNDLSMRIDLEKTLAMAEGMYLQVMAVEEKLPNSIRTIVGLPEVEEPPADNLLEVVNGPNGDNGRNSASPRPYPEITTTTSSTSASRSTVNVPDSTNNTTALSTSPDAVALENQYEIGVSQFM